MTSAPDQTPYLALLVIPTEGLAFSIAFVTVLQAYTTLSDRACHVMLGIHAGDGARTRWVRVPTPPD